MTGRRDGTRADPGDDVGTSLVLNALADVAGYSDAVLADSTSRSVVREAYRAVTDADERAAFERSLERFRDDGANGEAAADERVSEAVGPVVGAVYEELVDRGVRTTVHHEAGTRLSPRSTGLFEYARTRDPSVVGTLPLSPAVREHVGAGMDRVAEERYDAAVDRFQRAMEAASTTDEAVATRILAALVHHWNGADARAMDLVEETRRRHPGAWEANVVGLAAGHPAPETFRDGALSVRAYLRMRTTDPPEGDVRASVGTRDVDDDLRWASLSGDPSFMPLAELSPETRVRLELEGALSSMPTLHTYYLALGVVDERRQSPRTVDHVFIDGPVTADASETLRFEPR